MDLLVVPEFTTHTQSPEPGNPSKAHPFILTPLRSSGEYELIFAINALDVTVVNRRGLRPAVVKGTKAPREDYSREYFDVG